MIRAASFLIAFLAFTGVCKADKVVYATEMNIVGDGVTLNTEAIQKAIDYCHSQKDGACLVFTKGVYRTGTIVLKSNVTLKIEKDAVISGSVNPYDYYTLEDPKGMDSSSLGLVLANHAENIRITGEGTIDGNGRELARQVDSLHHIGERVDPAYDHGNRRPNERMRPKLLFISNCKNVTVDGLNMRSSAAWGLSFDTCENLTLTNLDIHNRAFWNNDGIDVTDSRHVRISHCNINSADDSICLKSYRVGDCNDDIEIIDCDIVSSASAIKFGTASWGGFKNVNIRDIRVRDTYRSVIALESVDGGHIENILVEDVFAVNTWNAIFIRLGHRGGEAPGTLKNVTIRNMHVDIPFGRPDINYDLRGPNFDFFHNPIPSSITGIPGHCVENVTLENIEVFCPGRASKGMAYVPLTRLEAIPEKIDDYPEFTMFGELPCYGLFARHVRGLTLKNVNYRLKDSDFRPEYVFDDVEDACTPAVKNEPKAKHVFFIGLDGWGSYSVDAADMPNIKALMNEGCYTLQKRAVLPSKSAVNWASIFMGVPTEIHGYVRWDSMEPDIPVYQQHVAKNNILPTIFQVLREQRPEAEIGCIYEWDGIKYLVDTLSLNYHAQTPDYEKYPGEMSKMACSYIKEKKPDFAAFIYDNPDCPGHKYGFHTPEYYENLKQHDAYVGEIIAAIKEAGIYDDSIIIVTSDHGGIGTDHGGYQMEELETPFIIAGKNVKKSGKFSESMMQYDVAATIAEIFALETPQVWTSKSMSHVFE